MTAKDDRRGETIEYGLLRIISVFPRIAAIGLLLASLCALACSDGAAAERRPTPRALDATGHYPADISPPPGTQYPCALTALPRGLPGIAEADRAYINRTYARILRATQSKLVALKALYDRRDISGANAKYDTAAANLLAALQADVPPKGLEPFHADVIRAIQLQRAFFQKAAPLRSSGSSMEKVFEVPEGREASSRLFAAWDAMQSRYPDWPEQTKDSIYHHLCALDFF